MFSFLVQKEPGEEWLIETGNIDMENFNINNEWKFFNINENNIDQERLNKTIGGKCAVKRKFNTYMRIIKDNWKFPVIEVSLFKLKKFSLASIQ